MAKSTTLDELSDALDEIDRPGSYCTSGSMPAVLPGLEVEGLGPVALPLTAAQAKELKKRCEQAPYGKGVETVVDTKVRRVWRMAPARFSLTNPDWEPFIAEVVGKVQVELGLEGQKLQSHLYDLLLYEPGSFFLPHRDGEKLDRMVATLVVVLPSPHEGAEIVVRHEGQERTIDFSSSRTNPFQIHFAAFYADCEHEVRPLREGHRLCLVYNLALAKSKKPIRAPRVSEHIERVARLLREWAKESPTPKLAITLEHQYSQDGLSWDALKGVDRARARVLFEAAGLAGCHAYLALLTKWETGSAEYADDRGYGYGYRSRRSWDDEDDEDEDNGSEYEMGEVLEESLTADHWIDGEGKGLPIGELGVDEEEILDAEALTEFVVKEEFEGYTGNAGMTLERWYRRAAVFVWPESRHFEVICDNDGRNVVPLLTKMVARLRKTPKEAPALKEQCTGLARALLASWRGNTYGRHDTEAPNARALLKALAELDDPGLIGAFLGDVLTRDAGAAPDKSLVTICQKYGWATFGPQLRDVMRGTTVASMERNVQLLEMVCLARPRQKDGWGELCASLAQELVPAIEADDEKGASSYQYRGSADRREVLAGLARSLIATGQDDLLSRMIAHALATPRTYPLREAHVQALSDLRPWLKTNLKRACPPLSRWVAACREQLEALTAEEPREPADFRREAPVSCKCGECGELRRFLKDPAERVYRFSMREERRRHLEDRIRSAKCDLDLTTERRGSPHTLVCTKNTASFKARLKTYHEDMQLLATVRAIEKGLPG